MNVCVGCGWVCDLPLAWFASVQPDRLPLGSLGGLDAGAVALACMKGALCLESQLPPGTYVHTLPSCAAGWSSRVLRMILPLQTLWRQPASLPCICPRCLWWFSVHPLQGPCSEAEGGSPVSGSQGLGAPKSCWQHPSLFTLSFWCFLVFLLHSAM